MNKQLAETLKDGIALQQRGKLDDAATHYLSIAGTNPDCADAYNLLGTVYGQQGKLQQALTAFDKAISIRPDRASYYYNKGQMLQMVYRLGETEECYVKTLKLNPNHADALRHMANVCRHRGELQKALDYAERGVKAHLDNPRMHNTLGEVYDQMHDFVQSEQCYRQAIAMDPTFAPAYANLGTLMHNLNRTDEAITFYEQTLEYNPHQPTVRHLLSALKGITPEKPENAFVTGLFDYYADSFDGHMQQLCYVVPETMYRAVKTLWKDSNPTALHIVDLGCGTGKCGALFRPHASKLVGVDLSPKMLQQAHGKMLYDQLLLGDLESALEKIEMPIDIAIAADVFIYVGKLDSVFASLANKLSPGGLLAFSLEDYTGKEPFSLCQTGRYQHSHAYIDTLLAKHGLTIVQEIELGIRKQFENMIPGRVILAQANK